MKFVATGENEVMVDCGWTINNDSLYFSLISCISINSYNLPSCELVYKV